MLAIFVFCGEEFAMGNCNVLGASGEDLLPKVLTDGGEDSPDNGDMRVCRVTAREDFRETLEHPKVPTDVGEEFPVSTEIKT